MSSSVSGSAWRSARASSSSIRRSNSRRLVRPVSESVTEMWRSRSSWRPNSQPPSTSSAPIAIHRLA